jgi:hypothetical protein
MGKFEDYIRSIDPATPLPEGLLTNLQAAYAEDISLSEAKVASVESALADKDAEVVNLGKELTSAKSHNYDLLMNIPHTVDEIDPPGSDDDTVITVDKLFGVDNDS